MHKPCWIESLEHERDLYTFRHTFPAPDFPEKLAKLRELFGHEFRLLRGGSDWCWCVPATMESRNLLCVVFENANGAFQALDRQGSQEENFVNQDRLL